MTSCVSVSDWSRRMSEGGALYAYFPGVNKAHYPGEKL